MIMSRDSYIQIRRANAQMRSLPWVVIRPLPPLVPCIFDIIVLCNCSILLFTITQGSEIAIAYLILGYINKWNIPDQPSRSITDATEPFLTLSLTSKYIGPRYDVCITKYDSRPCVLQPREVARLRSRSRGETWRWSDACPHSSSTMISVVVSKYPFYLINFQ